jgi:hypothetical protein
MPDKCRISNDYRVMFTEGCPDLSGAVRVSGLTVNQPPHGFEGSSPSFPTTLRPCGLRVAQQRPQCLALLERSESVDGQSLLAMTSRQNSKYDSAIPRRDAPEFLQKPFAQKNRGRRECRVLDAPAASRAIVK